MKFKSTIKSSEFIITDDEGNIIAKTVVESSSSIVDLDLFLLNILGIVEKIVPKVMKMDQKFNSTGSDVTDYSDN